MSPLQVFAPSPLLRVMSWLCSFEGHYEQKAMREGYLCRWSSTTTGVSWSTVPLCGTVCWLCYVHRTRHWTYLKINWKLSSSELSTEWVIADAANLRGINHLIIIIIIVLLATETKQLTSPQFQQRTLSSRSWASFCLNVAVAWQRLPSLEWTLTLGLMDFRHQLVWLNPLFPRHSTPLHATPLDNCHSAHRPLSMTVLTWIYSVHNKNKT